MIGNILFMGVIIISVLIFIVSGMQHGNYRGKHPVISNFYGQEIIDKFDEKFPIRVATGVGILLIGLFVGMNGEDLPLGPGMTEDVYYGIFMLLVAITLVYSVYVYSRFKIAQEVERNVIKGQIRVLKLLLEFLLILGWLAGAAAAYGLRRMFRKKSYERKSDWEKLKFKMQEQRRCLWKKYWSWMRSCSS